MRAYTHIHNSRSEMPSSAPPTGLKPRKSPKQQRSAETVRVILEGAARVLERGGLAGYTTNAVAECAGVSIGSLYQYFPGKEALTAALILQETSMLLKDAATALQEPTGHASLDRLIIAAVTHQLRRPALARLLDFEEARLPLNADTQRVADQLRLTLEQILGRPDLPVQPDIQVAAADLLGLAKGMIDAAGERGEIDSQQLEKRVRRAVFGYLAQTAECDSTGSPMESQTPTKAPR
jgi:AcrR family transcriptional regulator